MTNEVKNDVDNDDVEAFEKAEEAGEVKTSEREISEEQTEEKTEEEESKSENETDEDEESEEEESKKDIEVESSKPEIKEVVGETPKETALRLEVTRLRRGNRKKEQDALLETEKENNSDEYEEELKELGYDGDQIKTLDKAFDIIGKKKGFVRKDQSYKEMADTTLSDFIEEHPEYSAENDKDDIHWGRFNSILKSDYNLKNKTPKELKSIFRRVDIEIKSELGEEIVDKKVLAKKQKVKSVASGTISSTKSEGEIKTTENKNVVSSGHPGLVFKGFDDDEVKEFTN